MKKDLILLHGALGSRRQLAAISDALSGSFNLLVPDFPGHGDRTSGHAFTIRSMADDLLVQLEASGLKDPHIFGYSMGGYVGLYLASQDLFPLGNIMTYGTRFNWSEDYALQQQKMLDPEKMKEKVPAYADYLADLHGKDLWENVVRQTAVMMQELGKEPLLDHVPLGQVRSGVWITRGTEDNMVSAEESIRASEQLHRGEYIEIGQQPHPIEKVEVSAIAQLIFAAFA